MSKNGVITVDAARAAGQAIKQVAQSLQGLAEREAVEGALAVSFERLALIGQMSAVLNQPQRRAEYRDWETDRKSTRLNSSHRL